MSKYIKLDDAIWIITEHQGIRGDTFKALHNAYVVDITRCSECKHYKEDWCYWRDVEIRADDFCSYGIRREDGKA